MGMRAAIDAVTRLAIIARCSIHAVESARDADSYLTQRLARRTVKDHGMMQLAACCRLDEQLTGGGHRNISGARCVIEPISFSKTSSTLPFPSTRTNRCGSDFASDR